MLLHSTSPSSTKNIEQPTGDDNSSSASSSAIIKNNRSSDWQSKASWKNDDSEIMEDNKNIRNEAITSFQTSLREDELSSAKIQLIHKPKSLNLDDDDDECDVPDLIAEDSMEAALRLDILQSDTSLLDDPSRSKPFFQAETLQFQPEILSDAPLMHDSSASPTPASSRPKRSSLRTSCLRKSSTSALRKRNSHTSQNTARRVHGLWDDNVTIINPDDGIDISSNITTVVHPTTTKKNPSIFSQLREETIVRCLSYLEGEPLDLLAVSQVNRRFHSIVTTTMSLWKTIDATNFVHHVFEKKAGGKQTSKILGDLLSSYPPETLVIRNIGTKLQADESFLPASTGRRLKNLTLTHFEDLTDTHVHVLLLILALPPSKNDMKNNKKPQAPSGLSNSLHQLALEDCPKLTNATVRSIAASPSCVELSSLSLRGDSGITDLLPLSKMLQIKPGMALPNAKPTATVSNNPLASLFGGPSPKPKPKATVTPALGSLFAPPKPHSKPSTPALGSLFAPPPSTKPSTPALGSLFAPPPPSKTAITKPATTPAPAALSSLFAPPPPTAAASTKPATTTPAPTLNSLFAPPPPSKPSTVERQPSPPASPPKDRATDLHSLFAPPGTSPPRQTTTNTTTSTSIPAISTTTTADNSSIRMLPSLSRQTSVTKINGTLSSIDIRSTKVSPRAWLDCCQEAATAAGNRLGLLSLHMDGTQWSNHCLQEFMDLVSAKDLRLLHLANSQITNLEPLEGATRLRSLCLQDDKTSTDNNKA